MRRRQVDVVEMCNLWLAKLPGDIEPGSQFSHVFDGGDTEQAPARPPCGSRSMKRRVAGRRVVRRAVTEHAAWATTTTQERLHDDDQDW